MEGRPGKLGYIQCAYLLIAVNGVTNYLPTWFGETIAHYNHSYYTKNVEVGTIEQNLAFQYSTVQNLRCLRLF